MFAVSNDNVVNGSIGKFQGVILGGDVKGYIKEDNGTNRDFLQSNIFVPKEIFVPKYLGIQQILDEHERVHWLHTDANLSEDISQWKKGQISDAERRYIRNVLRLFTQADTDVCAMYVNKLLPVFGNADARMMLLSFANREVTHIKAYKKLNEALGYDSEEFMSEFLSFSQMKQKHEFMIEESDLSTPAGVAEYLGKQVLMEGINLFASFAMLLSWSQVGKLPGCVSINKWSIADESIHVRGLCELFKVVLEENPKVVNNGFKATIYDTARTIVRLEDEFIDLSYSVGENSVVTAEDLKSYIRYVCDYRMQQLGLKAQFGVKNNPLGWMDHITSNIFTNFFEATVTEYSKGSLVGEWVY